MTHYVAIGALLTAFGCGAPMQPGDGPPPRPPDGCEVDPLGIGFSASSSDERIDDVFVPAPPPPRGSAPPCAGTHLLGQRLTTSAWGTAFPGGVDRRVGVCVANGIWTGRLAPGVVIPPKPGPTFPPPPSTCGPAPSTATITVKFAMSYEGDFDRLALDQPPEACIYRSGMSFARFEVTGIAELDADIRTRIESDVLAEIDRRAADEINQRPIEGVTSQTPLPDGRSGRCPGWSRSSLPLPVP